MEYRRARYPYSNYATTTMAQEQTDWTEAPDDAHAPVQPGAAAKTHEPQDHHNM